MNGKVKIPLRPVKLRATQTASLTCRECSLDKAQLQHPKMRPTGTTKPVFYFIGEAPDAATDQAGEQFVGESGDVVRSRIPSKWVNTIRWNNTIRCFPGDQETAQMETA